MMRRRQFLAGAMLAIPALRLARAKGCAPTEAVELGPYYRPDAPSRASLVSDEDGEPLAVEGRVFGAGGCAPLAGAVVEVWQADAAGRYDIDRPGPSDRPFRLRSLLRAGRDGGYGFDTIQPGGYLRRARHIHYFVHAEGHEPLVTQLYFAGDARLATDPLVRRSLVAAPVAATVRGRPGARVRFDVVLRRRTPTPAAAVRGFASLEGEYDAPSGGFQLLRRADQLFGHIDGMPDVELLFDGRDRFRVLELGLHGRVVHERGAIHIDTVDASGARERATHR